MSTVRWSDIRDKHVEAIGREDVERGTPRLISQVRAHRPADMLRIVVTDSTGRAELSVEVAWISPAPTADSLSCSLVEQLTSSGGGGEYPARGMRP